VPPGPNVERPLVGWLRGVEEVVRLGDGCGAPRDACQNVMATAQTGRRGDKAVIFALNSSSVTGGKKGFSGRVWQTHTRQLSWHSQLRRCCSGERAKRRASVARKCHDVIVTPLSTMGYVSVASVFR